MMNRKITFVFVAISTFACMAPAQNSKIDSSSAKTGADPLKTATQPLTPKSPTTTRRTSAVSVPNASTHSQDTNAELTRLERQSAKVGVSKNSSAPPAKGSSVKPNSSSSGSGSGINSSYQKPRVPHK